MKFFLLMYLKFTVLYLKNAVSAEMQHCRSVLYHNNLNKSHLFSLDQFVNMLRIVNISATFEVGHSFNLRELERSCIDIVYNPSQFSAAKYRCLSPSYSALLFYNGKVTLTGTTSKLGVQNAATDFCRFLSSLGYEDIAVSNIVINQYVGALDLQERINLTQFYDKNKAECVYEVELFPGLTYKPTILKATFVMFSTGKINITGCSSLEQLKEAANLIKFLLKRTVCSD